MTRIIASYPHPIPIPKHAPQSGCRLSVQNYNGRNYVLETNDKHFRLMKWIRDTFKVVNPTFVKIDNTDTLAPLTSGGLRAD